MESAVSRGEMALDGPERPASRLNKSYLGFSTKGMAALRRSWRTASLSWRLTNDSRHMESTTVSGRTAPTMAGRARWSRRRDF